MPSLQSVLGGIPFAGGYYAGEEQDRQAQAGQLAQAQGLMGILAQVRAQQEAQKKATLADQFRAELQAAGGDPEKQVAVARKYGDPTSVLHYAGQSLDARAKMEAAKLNAEAQREQHIREIELRGKEAIERVREAERERRITREEADRREATMRENLLRMTAALRPAPQPRQEPAPSITEIVDPKSPDKLIRVDTRTFNPQRYLAGDATGVIGVSGKEPTAAKREQEKELGRRQITSVVDQLAAKYDELEKMGAVITPKQAGVKNIYERAAASGPGQIAAGFLGTKAQAVRDQINNSKPLLMAAIKQASGMSSQQLNSNAELQFYLQAASDPAKSIESNRAALAILDQTYGLGTGVTASQAAIDELRKAAPRVQTQGLIGGGAAPTGGVKFLGFE